VKVCLISVEIFAWGKYGGFGKATRTIGRELVKRGIEVFAVVPRRAGQKPVEKLDGFTVLSFPPHFPFSAMNLFKECDADIHHSCEPSFGTYLAMKAMPHKKHLVTCRDPRDFEDWKMEFELPSLNKLQVIHNYIYENNFLVKRSVRRMDGVYTTAKYLVPKVRSIYGLNADPVFLPTPVIIPEKVIKSEKPTVCYVARLDRRKRPEIFFDLAREFPEVQFIAVGKSRDGKWDSYLREKYSNTPNLEMAGFVDQFSSNLHTKILEKSWIMINTATREGLANSFLEASAHRCAILSFVDPDGFATEFGHRVQDGNFVEGLKYLLDKNRWEEQGQKGYQYVKEHFELNKSIDNHLNHYRETLEKTSPGKLPVT
jgi:glycosyltransferase involved in cell wall biosynthesis